MVLLHLEKNSTATRKPWAENSQSTDQPTSFATLFGHKLGIF